MTAPTVSRRIIFIPSSTSLSYINPCERNLLTTIWTYNNEHCSDFAPAPRSGARCRPDAFSGGMVRACQDVARLRILPFSRLLLHVDAQPDRATRHLRRHYRAGLLHHTVH